MMTCLSCNGKLHMVWADMGGILFGCRNCGKETYVKNSLVISGTTANLNPDSPNPDSPNPDSGIIAITESPNPDSGIIDITESPNPDSGSPDLGSPDSGSPDSENSNVRVFDTGAKRTKDADDVRFDLISAIGLERLAKICAEGAKKYGDRNWLKGFPISDLMNHGLRHWNLYNKGDRSEDHLAKLAWAGFQQHDILFLQGPN